MTGQWQKWATMWATQACVVATISNFNCLYSSPRRTFLGPLESNFEIWPKNLHFSEGCNTLDQGVKLQDVYQSKNIVYANGHVIKQLKLNTTHNVTRGFNIMKIQAFQKKSDCFLFTGEVTDAEQLDQMSVEFEEKSQKCRHGSERFF